MMQPADLWQGDYLAAFCRLDLAQPLRKIEKQSRCANMAGAAWHKVGTIASRRLKAQGVISFGRVARTWSAGGGQIDVERKMATATGVYGNWDRFGRTLKQRWFRSTTTYDQVDYTYDHAGNRLTRDIPSTLYATDDRDQAYIYDGLQRLKNAQQGTLASGSISSKNFEQDWTLDQLGNWPTFKQDSDGDGSFLGATDFDQARTHNAVNELETFSGPNQSDWADPVHDAAGNMTEIPRPLSPILRFVLTYDAWNRLTEVRATTGSLIAAYEYDGLGQRIQKIVGSNTFDYYYNDKWQVLTEAKNGTAEAIYAWHLYYIDALAVRFRANDQHYFLHDDNFNVTAAYDVNPSSGTYRQVVERYRYTPYGQAIILDANFAVGAANGTISDIDNVYLYTGRERDPETGLQLNRNRFYHAGLGRWLTRDPIQYEDFTNLYLYCLSSPLTAFDPNGTETQLHPGQVSHAASNCKWACLSCKFVGSTIWHLGTLQIQAEMNHILVDCRTEATHVDPGLDPSGVQHSALRHCICAARLAKKTSCLCSECLGNSREHADYEAGIQGPGASQTQLYNNFQGRKCGGCDGDRAHEDPSWIGDPPMNNTLPWTPVNQVPVCCKKALEDGTLHLDYDVIPPANDDIIGLPPRSK